jgi:hypothetical protein
MAHHRQQLQGLEQQLEQRSTQMQSEDLTGRDAGTQTVRRHGTVYYMPAQAVVQSRSDVPMDVDGLQRAIDPSVSVPVISREEDTVVENIETGLRTAVMG